MTEKELQRLFALTEYERPFWESNRLVGGADEAGRALGQHLEIDVGGEFFVLGMDFQDRFAPLHVGRVHDHVAVETPGAQQRRVEHVGAVGPRLISVRADGAGGFLGGPPVNVEQGDPHARPGEDA